MSSALLLQGFSPIIDQHTHTLILGSFPSQASLEKAQYYAHPRNQFWRLLSHVIDVDLLNVSYSERLQLVLKEGIGIWDTIQSCQRVGSLDSAIRQAQLNDVLQLQKIAPHLKKICFNGKKAAKLQTMFEKKGWMTYILPSSSPAYASMSFEEKCLFWKKSLHDAID